MHAKPQDLFSKKDYVFAGFEGLLKVAKPLVEATNVPMAKGALEIVSQIIELVKAVKSNKDDCKILANRCLDLLSAIYEALDSKGSLEANKRLYENTSNLKRTLDSIKDTMTDMSKIKLFVGIIQSSGIKERIRKHNVEIDGAMELFNLRSILTIQSTVIDTNLKVTQMLNTQEKVLESSAATALDNLVFEREPPTRPSIFFGRNDYVEEVVYSIIDGHPLRLSILGPGGIGKTSAASAIIDHDKIHAKFNNSRFFINCSTFLTTYQMLQALCGIIMGADGQKYDPKNPLRALSHFLGAFPSAILVLDNFETVWHVQNQDSIKKMLQTLFKLNCLTLIITMRGNSAPDGFTWSRVGSSNVLPVLNIDDAKKIFRAICGSYEDSMENDADLSVLMDQLDRVPLAVSIVAKMANSDTSAKPKQISANLGQFLETGRVDPYNSVKASISLSVNSYIIKQRPESIDVLKVIAYLPGGVTSDSIAKMTNHRNARQLIAALQNVGLIHGEGERFNTLSPIRICIEEDYPLDSSTQQSVFQYYFRICAEGPSAYNSLEVKSRLGAEKANCFKLLVHAASSYETDSRYLNAVIDFSWFLCYTIPSTEFLQQVEKHFRASNDVLLLAKYHHVIGEMARVQWDFKEARRMLLQARNEFDSAQVRVGAAQCLRSLGNIAGGQGNYDEAKEMLLDAKEQFDGAEDTVGATQCLRALGEIARVRGDYEEAKKMFLNAKAQFDGVGDSVAAARCLQSLGVIAGGQGNPEEARKLLLDAKNQFERVGVGVGVAQCLQSLGDIAGGQGNYEEAKKMLLDAKDQFGIVGVRGEVAQCLRRLGDVARVRCDFEEANKMLLDAKEQLEGVGDRVGAAHCLQSLGEVAGGQGNYTVARKMLLDAKGLFNDVGDTVGAARCLQRIGELARVQGDYEDAWKMLLDAKAKFDGFGDRRRAAQCLQSLGIVAYEETRYEDARKMHLNARVLFESIGDWLGVAQCTERLELTAMKCNDCENAEQMLIQAEGIHEKISSAYDLASCSLEEAIQLTDKSVSVGQELQQLSV